MTILLKSSKELDSSTTIALTATTFKIKIIQGVALCFKNHILVSSCNPIMESSAFFYTIFLWCLLLSITGYSIYVGFGPPSKQLRDPFEEHED